MKDIRDAITASVVGAAIGDSLGGALEFAPAKLIRKTVGREMWVDDLIPYQMPCAAHGPWLENAPAGIITDDTRLRVIFLEKVIANRGKITPKLLAEAYLEREKHLKKYYPGFEKLARSWLGEWTRVAAAYLGKSRDGIPPEVVLATSWGGVPTAAGILVTTHTGLMHPGNPEKAYKLAFDLAIHDSPGYGKDACGLYAGLLSVLVTRKWTAQEIRKAIKGIVKLDPYGLGKRELVGRHMVEYINRAIRLAERAHSGKGLAHQLALNIPGTHWFDPAEMIAVAMACVYYTGGDFEEATVIASNHHGVDRKGRHTGNRDCDTTGGFAGGLAGAATGSAGIRRDWWSRVVTVNRTAFKFDLEELGRKFAESLVL
jgi:ADP-ribosylglycohydrolase